VKNIPAITHFI